MKVWRQGDLYLSRQAAVPPDAKPRRGRVVLRGELTGHAHEVEGGTVDLYVSPSSFDRWRPGDVFYLDVRGPGARLVHQEHGPIALHPGVYRVWRQREYTPGGARWVQD